METDVGNEMVDGKEYGITRQKSRKGRFQAQARLLPVSSLSLSHLICILAARFYKLARDTRGQNWGIWHSFTFLLVF